MQSEAARSQDSHEASQARHAPEDWYQPVAHVETQVPDEK